MEPPQQLARPRAGRLEHHAPLRVRDVLEMYVESIRRQRVASAIRPLDHRDATAVERLLPAGRAEVLAFEAIQVGMEERHASTVMLAKDDEGRARDIAGVESESRGDAFREHGLSRAEVAPEREDVARTCEAGEPLADPLGVHVRMAELVKLLLARLFGIGG